MRAARHWILVIALVLGPAVAGAQQEPAPAPAGTPGTTKPWNQEEVTALSAQLAEAVRDLRREVKRTPPPGLQSMQQNSWYRFTDSLRLIESEAKIWARELKNGQGQAETQPIYDRMWVLVRNARESAKRLLVPEPVQKKIETARGLLDQLDAYYP